MVRLRQGQLNCVVGPMMQLSKAWRTLGRDLWGDSWRPEGVSGRVVWAHTGRTGMWVAAYSAVIWIALGGRNLSEWCKWHHVVQFQGCGWLILVDFVPHNSQGVTMEYEDNYIKVIHCMWSHQLEAITLWKVHLIILILRGTTSILSPLSMECFCVFWLGFGFGVGNPIH